MIGESQYSTQPKVSPAFLLFTRSLLAIFLVLIFVYGGYWLYLSRGTHRPISEWGQGEPFLELGRAALRHELGEQMRVSVVPYAVPGPDDCSFWTFEAVRSRCRGVGIVVPGFEEHERQQIVDLVKRLATPLAQPCAHLQMLALNRQQVVASQLGCGRVSHSFTLRVQAFSSELIPSPGGGGSFRNKHICATRLHGVI